MRRRLVGGLVTATAWTGLAGCKGESPAPAPEPATEPAITEPAAVESAAERPPLQCTGDGSFASLTWIPSSARMLIAVELASPGVDDAVSLLSAHVKHGEHGLPLLVDLDLSVLSTEL
ncbi:MAG: hypothetical protein ACPHRO_15635, partial [Nannocystaceae bacterium]